jgi:UDP-GlcNAc:undecaprenyl-phosphate GlcNAc-1-phosphate transferase
MNLFAVAAASLVTGLFFLKFGSLLLVKMGLVDDPVKYGFERSPVAYSMGIVLVLNFIGLSTFFLDLDFKLVSILLAVFGLAIVCFADDHVKFSPWIRLFVQFFVASLVVVGGTEILAVSNPLGGVFELGAIGKVFSVFWIVSITNLINFLDGVSGLSSGVASIGFLILLALSLLPTNQADQTVVQVLALIMFILAFLSFIFEFPAPMPKLLVGDSGTMFFGFMLAVLSMVSGGKLATAVLVLLIPVFDGFWVVSRRLYSRKSPFKGDLGHLHHRLERIGFSKQEILFIYIGISLLFGLIAVFVWNTFFKIVSLLVSIVALTVIGYFIWTKETK